MKHFALSWESCNLAPQIGPLFANRPITYRINKNGYEMSIKRILGVVLLAVLLTLGCTGGNGDDTKTVSQASDTVYTQQGAMMVYA